MSVLRVSIWNRFIPNSSLRDEMIVWRHSTSTSDTWGLGVGDTVARGVGRTSSDTELRKSSRTLRSLSLAISGGERGNKVDSVISTGFELLR